MFDRQWGMPGENWQQQGSFIGGATPPLDGPDGGDLIQLPCINKEWVALVQGSLDQLRNPSTWPGLTDAGLALVLNRVDLLREMMSSGIAVPCCNVAMRLTASCELQFSVDGGTTWATVTDWDANLDGCIKAHVPPQVPVPANPGLPQQSACSVAEWLRQQLFSNAVQKLHDALQAGQTVDHWITQVVDDIVAFAPVLAFIVQPFQAMYTTSLPQPLADLQDAVNDVTFQANVRCAIFQAIKNDGYVTAGNFAQVATNIAAIGYAHAWVPPMLANLWTNLGLQNIQTLQAEGSITAADCSGCTNSWCIEFDFTVSDHGWAQVSPGVAGNYIGGSGWVQSVFNPGTGNIDYIDIKSPSFGLTTHINDVVVFVRSGAYTGAGAHPRSWLVYLGGVFQGSQDYPSNGAYAVRTKVTSVIGSGSIDQVSVQWAANVGTGIIIDKIQITGTGLNPFGPDTCTE